MRRLLLLLVLLLCAGPALAYTGSGTCNHSEFLTSGVLQFGDVTWPLAAEGSPGTVFCIKGYKYNGTNDLVYCETTTTTTSKWILGDKTGKCLENSYVPTKEVHFHGMTYNYIYLKMGETTTVPVVNPNVSYIITTEYEANMVHPTIRVRVALIGKAINPVLINIQQSTESVGFELPMRVVGKGSKELAPINTRNVELCPVTLKLDEDEKPIPVQESVKVNVNSVQPKDFQKSLKVQVKMTYAQHIDLAVDSLPQVAHADDDEDLVYRFTWAEGVEEVDILVIHYPGDKDHIAGQGPDVCAKISLRSGTCPLEEMGVSEMTFTRKAFMTVNKHDERLQHIKDGFLLVISTMPDDYECLASPRGEESNSRSKTVQTSIRARTHLPALSYIAMPILSSCILIAISLLVYFLCIVPLFEQGSSDTDSVIIDVDDTEPILKPSAILPPFDQLQEEPPKIEGKLKLTVDCEEENTGEDEVLNDVQDAFEGIRSKNFSASIGGLSNLLKRVKQNELIVNLTQTIGHCSIPLLVFLNSFDSAYVDIQGNLKSYTLDGNLDACFINSQCAFPVNVSGYRVPDISRVTSNLPYFVSAICFYLLADQKYRVMRPLNARGLGVKHDFAIFYALAFITALIGLASAMYHVCPNQTTSRIDMYFIEILLGYYSLKLYQSRIPDIRAVYYAPAIVICVLTAIERVMGDSDLSWDLIAGFHIAFTLWVSVQLFFLGKMTMNPYTMLKERDSVMQKIKDCRRNHEFKYQIGAFLLGNVATVGIAISGMSGMWTDHAMYNVVALTADIVIYMVYYFGTKYLLRKEKIGTKVVVFLVGSALLWVLSFIFFFTYKSFDTTLSPAESRCLNKACIAGPVEGHDVWHCLSATAILLTNVMILGIDDDLIATKTEDTYF